MKIIKSLFLTNDLQMQVQYWLPWYFLYKSQSFRSQKVVLYHVEEMADTFEETVDPAEVVEEVDDQAEVVNNTTALCWVSLLVLIFLVSLKVFVVTPIEFWTKSLSWIACHCLTRSSLWCWLYCLRKWDLCMRRNYWLWRKEGSGNICKAIPAMKLVQMQWHFPLIFLPKGEHRINWGNTSICHMGPILCFTWTL